MSGILATCALLATAGIALAAKEPVQEGTFALMGGTQQTTAELRVKPVTGGLLARVRLFTQSTKQPITHFSVEMERTMHMVLIRDDFTTFAHLHPDIDITTGTFHQVLAELDPEHRYYLYADSVPQGMPQQVFRFNIQDNNIPAVPPAATLQASAKTESAGPYVVHLNDTTVAANLPAKLDIEITEHGKPAGDLTNYLGAASHAVFINASTLDYLHVHPTIAGTTPQQAMTSMQNGNPQSGPYQQAQLPALAPGSYKLWLQFRGGPGLKIYTAAFTIVSK